MARVFNRLAIHFQIKRQLIAAQRVVTFLMAVGRVQHTEVAGLFIVVEYDLLIEFA